jgi:arginine decarboxylase
MGFPMGFLDCGGGLGIDYDGSRTNFESSMNYTTEEYANDVVFSVMEACDAAQVPHPNLVSESGRAVVAHHAMLVTEVQMDGSRQGGQMTELVMVPLGAIRVTAET